MASFLSALEDSFPTLSAKNVPVPETTPERGWWHRDSAPLWGCEADAPAVAPNWDAHAGALIASGAMVETSLQYPSGGIRPGNNEPAFLRRYVPLSNGTLCMPHVQPAPFNPVPAPEGGGGLTLGGGVSAGGCWR